MKLEEKIKNEIYDSVIDNKLYGNKNIWDDRMIRLLFSKFPKETYNDIEKVINDLVSNGIFEKDETRPQYLRLTAFGEEEIYKSDYYSIEEVENKILTYFRDKSLFKNSHWPLGSYRSFKSNLVIYEERLFMKTINKMISDGLLIWGDDYSLILTEKCQLKIYGK